MDESTNNHLENWLNTRFSSDDTVNKDAARKAITEFLATTDDLEYWQAQDWSSILRASDFVEKFESEKPCHDRASIEAAIERGKLYVRTNAKNNWHVRKVEFDAAGNVKRFNCMFQPEKRFGKVELYGIKNESFYTLDF